MKKTYIVIRKELINTEIFNISILVSNYTPNNRVE